MIGNAPFNMFLDSSTGLQNLAITNFYDCMPTFNAACHHSKRHLPGI